MTREGRPAGPLALSWYTVICLGRENLISETEVTRIMFRVDCESVWPAEGNKLYHPCYVFVAIFFVQMRNCLDVRESFNYNMLTPRQSQVNQRCINHNVNYINDVYYSVCIANQIY